MMLNNSIAKVIFNLGNRLLNEDINKHLEQLKKTQWKNTSDLKLYQWNKLKHLVEHAYENSSYYKALFKKNNIRPDDIKCEDDLKKIPILTKENLKKHYQIMISKDKKYKYSIAKSSGSTGKSVKFYKDRLASGNGRAAMYRGHSWYGVEVGEREARLWGVPLNKKDKIKSQIGDFLLNRIRISDFNINDKIMGDFFLRMKKYRPSYLMGYSSLVYEYAKFIHEKKLDGKSFALKMVKVTAEKLFDYQREVIETVFDCPVANEYGAAEVGIVAFECPHGGLHMAMEGVYVEVGDKDEETGCSELLITDLDNYYTPIIRYSLGDYGKISKRKCSCGRESLLFDEIIGRTSDIVFDHNGKGIHSSIFSYILKEITQKYGGIKQYKIYQHKVGEIDIHINKDVDFNKNAVDFIKNQMGKYLGEKTIVNIIYTNYILREKSGKLRYFVSTI